MILVLGGIKGGTGKSICAANLAAMRAQEGKDVLLIDGDAQGTTWLWTSTRTETLPEATGITCIQLQGKAARTEVKKMAPKYDDVIIDCGGRDTSTQRAALTVADVVLIPFPPRGPDIWTLEGDGQSGVGLLDLLEEVRSVNDELKAWAFINRADSNGTDNKAAADIIKEANGIELIKPRLGDRKAFPNAHTDGLAVFEAKSKNSKAIAELSVLHRYCFSIK